MSDSVKPIVVAGHVCVDLRPELGGDGGKFSIEPGALLSVGECTVSPGGCVANVGLSLHRLGLGMRMVAKMGEDALGRTLTAALEARAEPGVLGSLVRRSGEATSYSIVIEPSGVDRAFMHCPGANATMTDADIEDAALSGAGHLHFGYPPVMPAMVAGDGEPLARLMERAKGLGLTTSLDMCSVDPNGATGGVDWAAVLEKVLPWVDLFCPSLDELVDMVGGEFEGGSQPGEPGWPDGEIEEQVVGLAERCLGWGAGAVALKMGGAGLAVVGGDGSPVASWQGERAYHPCFKANLVGTSGSGDATVAGLLAAVMKGLPIGEAARLACAVGGASVEAADATSGVVTLEEVEERVAQGWETMGEALGWGTSH